MNNGKISRRQFQILTLLFVLGPSLLFIPSTVATASGQDAWLSGIIGSALGIAMIGVYNAISRRYPDLTLIQICERIAGKWLGKVVSLFFMLLFFFLYALQIRTVGNFINIHMLDITPVEIIHLIVILLTIVAVRFGVETIARASELFFPYILLLLICMALLLLPEVKTVNLQPFMEKGWKPLLLGSLHFFSFQEMILLLMYVPYAARPKLVGIDLITGTLAACLILIGMIVLTIGVLGVDTTVRALYGSYTLAKKINIGNFLQRIEIIMAVIYMLTIFIRSSICLHVTAVSISQILNMKDYKLLTYPLGIITAVYATVLYKDDTVFLEFSSKIWWLYACTFFVVVPLLLWATSLVKGLFENRRNNEE